MIEGEGAPGPDQARRAWRSRRVTVDLRAVAEPLSDDELQRRERELERLIIKAACRRAWRLAAADGSGHAPGDDDARTRGTDDGLPSARGAR